MFRWIGAALTTAVLAGLMQLVTILDAPPASASCAPISDTRLFWDADVVFTGDKVRDTDGDPSTTIFDVERIYKGDVGPTTVITVPGLQNPNVVSSITLDLGDRARWLIFAHERRGGELVAFGCAGTRPRPAKIPAVLGIGYPPILPSRPGFRIPEGGGCRRTAERPYECILVHPVRDPVPWLAAAGVALLVLAAPGWWSLRMRRLRAIIADSAEEPRIRWVESE